MYGNVNGYNGAYGGLPLVPIAVGLVGGSALVGGSWLAGRGVADIVKSQATPLTSPVKQGLNAQPVPPPTPSPWAPVTAASVPQVAMPTTAILAQAPQSAAPITPPTMQMQTPPADYFTGQQRPSPVPWIVAGGAVLLAGLAFAASRRR